MKKEKIERWILEKLEVRIDFKCIWRTESGKKMIIAVCTNEEEVGERGY